MSISDDEASHLRERIRTLEQADKEHTQFITDLRLLVTEVRGLVSHMDKTISAMNVENRLKALENQALVVSAIKWGAGVVGSGGIVMILSYLFSQGA